LNYSAAVWQTAAAWNPLYVVKKSHA
jgi:hypothetical protein